MAYPVLPDLLLGRIVFVVKGKSFSLGEIPALECDVTVRVIVVVFWQRITMWIQRDILLHRFLILVVSEQSDT